MIVATLMLVLVLTCAIKSMFAVDIVGLSDSEQSQLALFTLLCSSLAPPL